MHAFATPIAAQQWAHYQRAVVDIRFGNHTLRIVPSPLGAGGGFFPERSHRTIHVITAFNPGGRTVPVEKNERYHNVLLDDLNRRSVTWWPAAGGDPDGVHIEKSAAVVGLSEAEARELGRSLGQDAVFAWTPSTWRLLSCVDSRVDECGWRITVPG